MPRINLRAGRSVANKTSNSRSNMVQLQDRFSWFVSKDLRLLSETFWSPEENHILSQAKKEVDRELGKRATKPTLEERWELISAKCKERALELPHAQILKRWHVVFQEDFSLIRPYQEAHPWPHPRDYWMVPEIEREELQLPFSFSREVYELMHAYIDYEGLEPISEASGSRLVAPAA